MITFAHLHTILSPFIAFVRKRLEEEEEEKRMRKIIKWKMETNIEHSFSLEKIKELNVLFARSGVKKMLIQQLYNN